MSEWTGCVLFDASKSFTVQADTFEEAAKQAYEEAGYASLCHQCAREIEVGDAIAVVAVDEAGNERTDDWREGRLERLEAVRNELLEVLDSFPGFLCGTATGDAWIEKMRAAVTKARGTPC